MKTLFGLILIVVPTFGSLSISGVESELLAQCVYTDLESDVPRLFSPPSGVENFRFDQTKTNWMAIAARPSASNDPVILLYQSAAEYPICVTGPLDDDARPGEVPVVVGNFNEQLTGTYYGTMDEIDVEEDVAVEWDDGNGALALNDSMLIRVMGADHVVDVWDVHLETGHTYGFDVSEISGDGLTLLIFRDPSGFTNWSGRGVAVLDAEVTGSMLWYTPQNTGDHAVVVVKNSTEPATYGIAFGECVTPTPIQSGVPVHPYGFQNYYQFDQQWWGWVAIAMQTDERIDGLRVYGAASGLSFPDCFASPLIWTNGHLALVARHFVDGGGPLPGMHYLRAAPSPGVRESSLEWEGQGGELIVNGPPAIYSMGPNNTVDVWGVNLTAGEDYTFHADALGQAYAYSSLFLPNEVSWQASHSAVGLGSRTTDYTATVTGSHGLVATTTEGYPGPHKVCVSTCGQAPEVEYAPDTHLIPAGETSARFSGNPTPVVWAGFAVLSDANWDLDVYQHPCGSSEPLCFSGLLKSSTDPGKIDFVVGDFNRNPTWLNFVHARHAGGTPADAHFQRAAAYGPLLLEYRHFRQLNPPHVIEVYDAPFIAGNEYEIFLEAQTGPDSLRLFVFEPSGDTYWARRGEHVLEATGTTSFTPSITANYGIAVINESSSSILYEISISSPTVSAELALPVSGIHSLVPNPTTGSIKIQFGLTSPQPVSFEIIDVAGRLIAQLPAATGGAGTWTQIWDGVGSSGSRPPAGVYFVRMKSGDSVLDLEKFVLLE